MGQSPSVQKEPASRTTSALRKRNSDTPDGSVSQIVEVGAAPSGKEESDDTPTAGRLVMVRPSGAASEAPPSVFPTSESAPHSTPGAASRFSGPPRLAPQVSLSRQQPLPSPRSPDAAIAPSSRQNLSFRGSLASPGSVQRAGPPPPQLPGGGGGGGASEYSLATAPASGVASMAIDDEFDDAPPEASSRRRGSSGLGHPVAALPSYGARGGGIAVASHRLQQQRPPLSSLATASSFSGASPPQERAAAATSAGGSPSAAAASLARAGHRTGTGPGSRLHDSGQLGAHVEAAGGANADAGDTPVVHIREDDEEPQQGQRGVPAAARIPASERPAPGGGGVTLARGSRGIVMQPVLPPVGASDGPGAAAAAAPLLPSPASLGDEDLRPWARGGAGVPLQRAPPQQQQQQPGGQTLRRPPSFAPQAAAFGSDADEIAEY